MKSVHASRLNDQSGSWLPEAACLPNTTDFFPLMAMGQVIEDHTNGVTAASFRNSLSRAARLQSINIESAGLLVDRLSPQLLHDWFHDTSRLPTSVDFEAFVTWRLLSRSRKEPILASPKLTSTMESYLRLPGAPRYAYLMWTEPASSPKYKELLISVLEDPSMHIHAVLGLARKSRQFIKDNLKLGELRMEEYRRELITHEISQE